MKENLGERESRLNGGMSGWGIFLALLKPHHPLGRMFTFELGRYLFPFGHNQEAERRAWVYCRVGCIGSTLKLLPPSEIRMRQSGVERADLGPDFKEI
jgi:hypothetical protein